MSFNNPEIFWLLLLIAPLFWWRFIRKAQFDAAITVSGISNLKQTGKTFRHRMLPMFKWSQLVMIILTIIIMARPQTSNNWKESTTEGIDIAIAMDVSGSMLAADFKPNRLEAAKEVAIDFIKDRSNDRIGLVVFAGESFTQCPLTTDHQVLFNLVNKVKNGSIEDGTAIGLGLANSINRIKESDAKSKVIILLTDGVNNSGEIAPLTAAEIAKTFGIRVYTIGVGKKGTAPYPVQTSLGTRYQQVEVKIDEGTLKEIAQVTGGEYFRANNKKELEEIYSEIDSLEKSKISVQEYSTKYEAYILFALLLLLLFITLMTLKYGLMKKLI